MKTIPPAPPIVSAMYGHFACAEPVGELDQPGGLHNIFQYVSNIAFAHMNVILTYEAVGAAHQEEDP